MSHPEICIKVKQFDFYSNNGLGKLLVTSYMDNNVKLSTEIIKELKVRSNYVGYIMGKSEQIKIIIEEVDFEKIQKVMKHLDWTWYSAAHIGKTGPPDIDDLRRTAFKLLEDIWNTEEGFPEMSTSIGGFVASRQIYNGIPSLKLVFELTNWGFDEDDLKSPNYSGEY
jgi:hypothetical protein